MTTDEENIMAQFNINAHLSNGKRLEWLVLPDAGETIEAVIEAVRMKAAKKFGVNALMSGWSGKPAGSGYIKVQMST